MITVPFMTRVYITKRGEIKAALTVNIHDAKTYRYEVKYFIRKIKRCGSCIKKLDISIYN